MGQVRIAERVHPDHIGSGVDLSVLNDFQETLQQLTHQPQLAKAAEDAIKVVNCYRFIKVNQAFIADYIRHHKVYPRSFYKDDRDEAIKVLRDFEDTSFHLNAFIVGSELDVENRVDQCWAQLMSDIELFESAISYVVSNDRLTMFIALFEYEDEVGCLDARVSQALQTVQRWQAMAHDHLADLVKAKVIPKFIEIEEDEFQAYQFAVCVMCPHFGRPIALEDGSSIPLTVCCLINYLAEQRGTVPFSELPVNQQQALQNLMQPNADAALQLIEAESAVIKTFSMVSRNAASITYLMNMLMNPDTFRPQKRLNGTENRNRIWNPNTGTIEMREGKDHVHRGGVKPPYHYHTKKTAVSLLPPNGKMNFYMRGDSAVGLVFSLDLCDLKDEKYMWTANVRSNDAFWVDPEDADGQARSVSIEVLRDYLRVATEGGRSVNWTELLICLSFVGLRAIAATEDTLLGRLYALQAQANVFDSTHRYIPLLVVNHRTGARAYTLEEQLADLEVAKTNDAAKAQLSNLCDDVDTFKKVLARRANPSLEHVEDYLAVETIEEPLRQALLCVVDFSDSDPDRANQAYRKSVTEGHRDLQIKFIEGGVVPSLSSQQEAFELMEGLWAEGAYQAYFTLLSCEGVSEEVVDGLVESFNLLPQRWEEALAQPVADHFPKWQTIAVKPASLKQVVIAAAALKDSQLFKLMLQSGLKADAKEEGDFVHWLLEVENPESVKVFFEYPATSAQERLQALRIFAEHYMAGTLPVCFDEHFPVFMQACAGNYPSDKEVEVFKSLVPAFMMRQRRDLASQVIDNLGVVPGDDFCDQARFLLTEVSGGNRDMLEAMLASPNMKDQKASIAAVLMLLPDAAASSSQVNIELAREILSHKNAAGCLNRALAEGDTPMHAVFAQKDLELMELYVAAGGRLHQPNQQGVKPLAVLENDEQGFSSMLTLVGQGSPETGYYIVDYVLTNFCAHAGGHRTASSGEESKSSERDDVAILKSFLDELSKLGVSLRIGTMLQQKIWQEAIQRDVEWLALFVVEKNPQGCFYDRAWVGAAFEKSWLTVQEVLVEKGDTASLNTMLCLIPAYRQNNPDFYDAMLGRLLAKVEMKGSHFVENRHPIHFAIFSGNLMLMQQYACAGADMTACDRQGKTAIDYALESEDRSVVLFGLVEAAKHHVDIVLTEEQSRRLYELSTDWLTLSLMVLNDSTESVATKKRVISCVMSQIVIPHSTEEARESLRGRLEFAYNSDASPLRFLCMHESAFFTLTPWMRYGRTETYSVLHDALR